MTALRTAECPQASRQRGEDEWQRWRGLCRCAPRGHDAWLHRRRIISLPSPTLILRCMRRRCHLAYALTPARYPHSPRASHSPFRHSKVSASPTAHGAAAENQRGPVPSSGAQRNGQNRVRALCCTGPPTPQHARHSSQANNARLRI